MAVQRCSWCEGSDAYRQYHDTEWGVPSRDDRHLFELLILEGAQAGLSWSTVLNRREGYRAAYQGFDADQVAAYGEDDVARLVADPGIIRNQAKVRSSIKNAKAFLDVAGEFGSFSTYLWKFVNDKPVQNKWTALDQVPAVTPLAATISKDLKRRGFGFVGPTIVYAYMQAAGLVNDHLVDCFRHEECARPG
ncbi:MAG: DNA-3-methyladenine glycosylase I [Armatimonadetes bacterium]|nr:DNA-3-methyladenine glycosylase I [Armatimonadota bacterium]